jgi:hypothetical protein
MSRYPQQKGTQAATAFVNFLILNGFPYAERRALHGAFDKGDVTGTIGLSWEVKNCKKYEISGWLKESEIERINAGADFGPLIIKPNRISYENVDQWWMVLPVGAGVNLLRDAGYGSPRSQVELP